MALFLFVLLSVLVLGVFLCAVNWPHGGDPSAWFGVGVLMVVLPSALLTMLALTFGT